MVSERKGKAARAGSAWDAAVDGALKRSLSPDRGASFGKVLHADRMLTLKGLEDDLKNGLRTDDPGFFVSYAEMFWSCHQAGYETLFKVFGPGFLNVRSAGGLTVLHEASKSGSVSFLADALKRHGGPECLRTRTRDGHSCLETALVADIVMFSRIAGENPELKGRGLVRRAFPAFAMLTATDSSLLKEEAEKLFLLAAWNGVACLGRHVLDETGFEVSFDLFRKGMWHAAKGGGGWDFVEMLLDRAPKVAAAERLDETRVLVDVLTASGNCPSETVGRLRALAEEAGLAHGLPMARPSARGNTV